ncbi:hypothetical protein DAEQUDRAFT_765941 [Daedalea quercina L-15889]|uniref:F-box domain-containing protein n=1 Tax=Daedalea quercina L-15889 TaxID=1314783 RepID=A0A165Q2R6_9APHY|nr:hypothetical protein DAEQUDRAFT_765941 [Daedalea quercina L-15889]
MYPDFPFILNRLAEILTPHPNSCKGQLPVPQEILDVIIDYLADDRKSLRACALVARAWRSRSQFYIHRTLKVTSKVRCKRAGDVYFNPFLVSCIRELHIQDLELKIPGTSHHWVDRDVPAMVSKLSRVHPLFIESVVIQNGHDIDWGSHPDPLFPNATRLSIHRLDFRVGTEFAAFIRHFPRLSSLTLTDFTIEYSPRDTSVPGPRPPLRNLEVYNSGGQEFFMNWFLHQPAGDIQLETFVYSIERWQLCAPQLSLRALGASVVNLTIVFAFESPHYLLRGDPILPYLSSVRSLTFDHATLYGTLYGTPSIPVLLKAISASHISTVRFRFTLDKHPGPLDQRVEKLERIKLAQTDDFLHDLQPFGDLQDVLIQVRSDEWSRLAKLHSADEWVTADFEHRRVPTPEYLKLRWSLRLIDLSDVPAQSHAREPDLAQGTAVSMERGCIRRSQAEYEKAVETWHRVNDVFKKAFPTMAARKLLRVEPLEDGASERVPSQPRHYQTFHPHERPHHHIGLHHHFM